MRKRIWRIVIAAFIWAAAELMKSNISSDYMEWASAALFLASYLIAGGGYSHESRPQYCSGKYF